MKLDPATIDKIRQMRDEGLTFGDIATRLGISKSVVCKYVNREPATDEPPTSEVDAVSGDLPDSESDGYAVEQCDKPGWWLILSDVHVPYHDTPALKLAISTAATRKPVGIILNGDIIDAPGMSKFLKEPGAVQLKSAVTKLQQFFGWLRGQFPAAEIVWKMGNHEARLYSYLLANAPALFGLDAITWASITEAKRYGVRVIEDDTQTIQLGKLPVLHGHEFARSFAPPVNPARGLYLRAKTSAICGHHHVSSTHVEKDVKQKQIVTWTTGCLCGLRPRYARFNNWVHGFAIVEVFKGGDYDVHNFKIFDGRVS